MFVQMSPQVSSPLGCKVAAERRYDTSLCVLAENFSENGKSVRVSPRKGENRNMI